MLEHRTERVTRDHASRVAKQVVFLKVVRELSCPLLLTPNRRDHPITFPGGNAMVAACFRQPILDGNPPVALAILDQAAASAADIGHLQVSEVFKTHACAAQDQHSVPVHRLKNVWFPPRFERASRLIEESIKLLKDIERKWPRLRYRGNGH